MNAAKTLVVAEHDNFSLNAATRHAVTAARATGGEIHLLVVGKEAAPIAEAAAKIEGVDKLILMEAEAAEAQSPEWLARCIAAMLPGYSACLATATMHGKSLMPRLAALLDVSQISDIVAVEAPDVFVRPIYAGNALLTVQSTEAIQVITVRQTAFAPAGDGVASAPVERVTPAIPPVRQARPVSREIRQHARPELATASVLSAWISTATALS